MESEQSAVVSKEREKVVYNLEEGDKEVLIYDNGSLWLQDWTDNSGISFDKAEAMILIKALCIGYDLTIPNAH